jgi:hypothetical protein
MFGLSGRQIFILLVLVAILFAGSQYVPAYFTAFQLNDFIRQEVKFAASSRKTPENVRTEVVEKAEELNVPIKTKDVQITRSGPSFQIQVEYRYPIDLKVYQHELVFHTAASGEVFENARR